MSQYTANKQDTANLRISPRKTVNKFYLVFVLVSILVPAGLVYLYDKLAGGILNGFMASERKQGIVDGDLLLLAVNPLVMIVAYGFLVYLLRKYMGYESKNLAETILIFFLFSIATIVAILVVFWKAFTT